MLIKRPSDVRPSDITPESLYWNRRQFLGAAGALAGVALLPGLSAGFPLSRRERGLGGEVLSQRKRGEGGEEKPNSYDDITHYNNYYEFGADKTDPADNSGRFRPRPWTVVVEGEVHKPKTSTLTN